MKKKKFKFNVKLCVVELSSVPFVSGILFTKIRLKETNKLTEYTSRQEVSNHHVKWDKDLEFEIKLVAGQKTGILEDFICRLSVRKEIRGGRSAQKLGFVDLNLAQFAGQGQVAKNFILQGYDEKHRLDNSTLRVIVQMTLTYGDPLFKVPGSLSEHSTNILTSTSTPSGDQLRIENKGDNTNSFNSDNVNTLRSLNGSGKNILRTPSDQLSLTPNDASIASDPLPSLKLSAGSATGHVRAQSLDLKGGHIRSHSAGSTKGFLSLRKPATSERDQRIDSTRVDAASLVDELIGEVSLDDNVQEPTGLQLFIGADGSASVTGHTHGSQTLYKPMNIPDR